MLQRLVLLLYALLTSFILFGQTHEVLKLTANDMGAFDRYGFFVSVSGNYAVVGAPFNSNPDSRSGAAYVYFNNEGLWEQVAKLQPSDPAINNQFGCSVDISGDFIIVGAKYNSAVAANAGAAYIFKNILGVWTEQNKIVAADAAANDEFGETVSISGDYAIIGAYGDDDNGSNSGSAYIFKNNLGNWIQDTKLSAPDGMAGDAFSKDLGLSIFGDYAIIGAQGDRDAGPTTGAAYVFYNNAGIWEFQTKLIASDAATEDYFGFSVDINDNYAVVGAPGNDDIASRSGCAYVFERSGAVWTQQSKLIASDAGLDNNFGYSIGLSGTNIIVGAFTDDDDGANSGSAYIFQFSSSWQEKAKLLASDALPNSLFGVHVAISNDYMVVGALNRSAAYVYMLYTWLGTDSYKWVNGENWLGGVIPGATDDVLIPTGCANYPTLTSAKSCNNMLLKSDASGTASLLDDGLLTINGTARVERYFAGNGLDWHLVSSPISNGTANTFLGMYLQSFNPFNYDYSEIIDPITSLNAMEGYGLYSTISNDNTITFTGELNMGTQSATCFVGNVDNDNWNLLGNPYVSSIDWEEVTIPAGLRNEVHYIDAATGNDLSYVQGTGGTGSQYIPPHQGFFVSTISKCTLSLNDSDRSHSGTDVFYKSENPNLLILKADGALYSDESWIHFNDQAEEEHDGIYDAFKLVSHMNNDLPQIFSITPNGDYLSVNGLPETSRQSVGFTAGNSGAFTISASKLMESTQIILEDKVTNEFVDLSMASHTFSYVAGGEMDRFVVHFTATAVEENTVTQAHIYAYGKDVYIKMHEPINAQVMIYNALGQEVSNTNINGRLRKIALEQSGMYIVKVQNGTESFTQKIILN